MNTRIVLKPRPPVRPVLAWMHSHPTRARRVVYMVVALVLLAAGIWGAKRWYTEVRATVAKKVVEPAYRAFSDRLYRRLEDGVAVPSFQGGNDPALRALLHSRPLLEGLVSRDGLRLWVRRGEAMVDGEDAPEGPFYRRLASELVSRRRNFLSPELNQDPDFGQLLTVASMGETWIAIQRIRPGHASFEAELELLQSPSPAFLANLRHLGTSARPGGGDQVASRTTQQIPYVAIPETALVSSWWTREYTPGWRWTLFPTGQLAAELWRGIVWRMSLLGIPVLIVSGLLFLGAQLQKRARQRAELVNDRLAVLTHGLKTPLAILRARCDAIRMGSADRDQTEVELIRLGDEIEQLGGIIENGLQAIRGATEREPGCEVTRAWLLQLAEDFQGLCLDADRQLNTHFECEGARTNLVSLRHVLQTLLENALLHGAGDITCRAFRMGKSLALSVSDQGSGLELHQLKLLGQPFRRFRQPGAEGFERPGMGLGLSLVVQIAAKEGWGLRFASQAGRGLTTTLELPLYGGRRSFTAPAWIEI